MNPTPQPHVSLLKFVLYIVVVIIFFVGGYFLGTGRSLMNQSASFYAGVQSVSMKAVPTGPTAQFWRASSWWDGNCLITTASGDDAKIIPWPCPLRITAATSVDIKNLQKHYNVPQTGVIDTATRGAITAQ